MSLLEVKNLHTYFKTKKGIVKAVNDVTYSLDAGKTLGIVGESGSGKSVSAMSIIKLLDGNGYIESGSITFDGKDILQCTDKEMYHIRGNEISVIFQEPMTSLNLPQGCKFGPRCKYCTKRCEEAEPPLQEVEPGHVVRCFYAEKAVRKEHGE